MPSAASSRSPEQREPSEWQVRFGKRSGTNQDAAFPARKTQTHQRGASNASSSDTDPQPSIGELLFSALKARERPLEPEEELSRDCAEQLLGKRNAFVPELRMHNHEQRKNVKPKHGGGKKDENDDDMMASAAREILQARFRCENQADEMRHLQKKKTARPMDIGARSKKTDAPTRVKPSVRSENTSAEGTRMHTLHGNKSMFELDVAPVTRQERKPSEKPVTRKTLTTTTNRSGSAASNVTEKETRGSSLTSAADRQGVEQHVAMRTLSRHVSSDPLKQMEKRQQRLRGKQAERTQASARDNTITTIATSTVASSLKRQTSGQRSSDLCPSSRNNQEQDEMQMAREQRLLQEKISRIAKENERAATIEADWQHALQQQRFVFSVWRQQLEQRQRQVMHARHTFEWRWLQRVWVHWRQYALTSQHARIVEATKANLVREKRVVQQADAFYRRKQLPIWFYRWSASVTGAKYARQLETAQQARKVQAQRLMERLVRQQDITGVTPRDDELKVQPAMDRLDRAVTLSHQNEQEQIRSQSSSVSRTSRPSGQVMRKTAWAQRQGDHSATTSASSSPPNLSSEGPGSRENVTPILVIPVVDPLYVSMQERAAERKQRRELLKQKYEQADQEKREAIEMQRADREARLLQQKLDEKQRIKERKREKAMAAQEKCQRIEARALQQRTARKHNAVRLLFYYGWSPLKRQWTLAKRVASNACAWHELRVLYAHWHRWLHFVHLRHLKRQRIEQQQLEHAALHHARVVKRRVFRSFQGVHERMCALQIAVERQSRWNDLRRTWSLWQQTLAHVRWTQQQHEQRVLQKWRVAKLRRLWIHWRATLAEWKQEQQEQQMKAQLWAKVRTWLDE